MLDKLFGICAAIAEGTTEAAAAGEAAAELEPGQIALQYLFTFAPIILIFVIFGLMAFANMNAYDAASSHFNEAASSQYSYSTQKIEK